jgi:hypothetical protein
MEPQVPPIRQTPAGGCDFLPSLQFAAGKLPRASANKHRRGPSTPRHKALCYAIDLRSASLRMTTLLGACNIAGCICRKPESHRLSGWQREGETLPRKEIVG